MKLAYRGITMDFSDSLNYSCPILQTIAGFPLAVGKLISPQTRSVTTKVIKLIYNTADFIKKVREVYARSMETICLPLRAQVAVGTFFMKSTVLFFCSFYKIKNVIYKVFITIFKLVERSLS